MEWRTARNAVVLGAVACLAAACGSDGNGLAVAPDAELSTDELSTDDSSTDETSNDDAVELAAADTAAAATTVSTTTAPPTTTLPPTTTAPPTTVPPIVFPPTPRVLLIGDSTMLAIERYGKLGALLGMDPVFEAKSCRLLAIPSCGKDPHPNAVATIDSAEGLFDIVIVMAGYDEWYTTFSDSFDQVVNSARAKGAKKIFWLTYIEGAPYLLPDGEPGDPSLIEINKIIREKLKSGAFPDVVITEWYHYSVNTTGWFNDDGIHLGPLGAEALADYLSRKVAAVAGLPCPMPREPNGPIENPCPDPDVTGPVPDVDVLYPD